MVRITMPQHLQADAIREIAVFLDIVAKIECFN